MTGRYRKKPVVIEAFRLGFDDEPSWYTDAVEAGAAGQSIDERMWFVVTLEGKLYAQRGDWIIRGVQGELYPCKPDIFEQTYEVAA